MALAEPHLTSAPTAMCLLHPPLDGSATPAAKPVPRLPEVVLATSSRTLLVVDEHDAQDQLLTSGPFVELAPSPNGKFLALSDPDPGPSPGPNLDHPAPTPVLTLSPGH